MALEQAAFWLHRQQMEASLVRWGEKADGAKDAVGLAAAARAALDAHVALGTAMRWAERAAALTRKDPAVLDTLARLEFEDGDVARAIATETEALAGTKDPDAKAAVAAALARFQAAIRVPREPAPSPQPGAPAAGIASPAGPSPRTAPPCAPGAAGAAPAAPAAPPAAPEKAPVPPCPPPAPTPVPPSGPCR